MESLYNVNNVFVVNNVARAATAGSVISGYSDLSDGEFVFVTPGGQVVDNSSPDAADYGRLRLIGRIGTQLVSSDMIDVSTIKRYKVDAYSAAAEQVDYVGYNGSANSIDVVDDTVYMLSLHFQGRNQLDFGHQRVIYGTYETGTSATQADVAIGVTGNLLASLLNEKKAGDQLVAPKAICNTGASATNDFTNDVTVVKGSKTFTVATNLTYNTAAGTLVVGDYVRFAAALNGTLAVTDDVYRVEKINSLAVTVDRPIQVPSGTWTDTGDGTQVIPAATGNAATWGIALTGVAKTWVVGERPFEKVDWYTSLKDFGTTVVTNSTGATEGRGTYQRVSELEWELGKGMEGQIFRTRSYAPAPTPRSTVSSSETYDILTIEYADPMVETLGQYNYSPKFLTLALGVTSNDSNQIYAAADATSLVAVLDDWIVTSYLTPGCTAQSGNLT